MNQVEILLVDDEADYAETMAFWLKAKGYRVRTVSSGEEALALLKKRAACLPPSLPRISFLDVLMPGMDGIETLRRIRAAYPALPVIMVTAYASQEKMLEAKALDVIGFFPKGADFSLAAQLIDQALQEIKR